MKFYSNKISLLAGIRFKKTIPYEWDLIRYDILTARNVVDKKSAGWARLDWRREDRRYSVS